MERSKSKAFSWHDETKHPGISDFYRCYSCHTLMTREQERYRMGLLKGLEDDRKAKICSCGAKKYLPTRPLWYEWLKPAVIRYTIKCVLAHEVAPRLDGGKLSFLLPLVEYLAMPKEA